jgi:hypothetical protein
MPGEIGGQVKSDGVFRLFGKRWLLGLTIAVGFTLLFAAFALYIHSFRPEAAGFERKGFPLLIYNVARLGFAAYLSLICYSVGYWTLHVLGLAPQTDFSGRKAFITCFFLGASLYGVAFYAFGLLQILSEPLGFALTLPFLLIARRPLRALLPARPDNHAPFAEETISSYVTWVLISVAAIAIIGFFVTRVMFIPNPDGNIWEHYLHYYRSVLESGSTRPNEIWHHFFNSKGGGLTLLANLLSDFFSVQLVSVCFVAAVGVIIFDLAAEYCRGVEWAYLATTLFFAYLFGDTSDGAMFRVHAVIMGYAGFFLWASVRLYSESGDGYKAIVLSTFVALAYMGLYQPVAMALFSPAFILVAIFRKMTFEKPRFGMALAFALTIVAGTVVTMVVNFLLTGLFEVTPMKVFWAIAQQEKAQAVLGKGGIEFFTGVNDLGSGQSLFSRLYHTMRHPFPRISFFLTLLPFLFLAARASMRLVRRRSLEKPEQFLLTLTAFLAPLALLTMAIPNLSVVRMGVYSIIYSVLATVVIWERTIDIWMGDVRVKSVFYRPDTGQLPDFSLKAAAMVLVILIASVASVRTAIDRVLPDAEIMSRFALGERSLKDTMELMEAKRGMVSGTSVKSVAEFRKLTETTGKILSLVYDASYAYLLPGEGIVSEPTYSIVDAPDRLLAAPPDVIVGYLQQKDIKYISVNLARRLFTTFAFTSLFDPRNIRDYFTLAYQNGDYFVLRLRSKAEGSAGSVEVEDGVPEDFLTVIDFKRTGALHFPFSEKFAQQLVRDNGRVKSPSDFEALRAQFLSELLETMGAGMLNALALDSSKALVVEVLAAVRESVLAVHANTGELPLDRANDIRIKLGDTKDQVRGQLLARARKAIEQAYVKNLGGELTSLSMHCDERVPYQPFRPVDTLCP